MNITPSNSTPSSLYFLLYFSVSSEIFTGNVHGGCEGCGWVGYLKPKEMKVRFNLTVKVTEHPMLFKVNKVLEFKGIDSVRDPHNMILKYKRQYI